MENNNPALGKKPLNWESFKAKVGCLDDVNVLYVNDYGEEIEIKNDSDFHDALKVAQREGKNYLRVILNPTRPVPPGIPVFGLGPKKVALIPQVPRKGNANPLQNHAETPPEWFSRYMVQFKNDILQEMKLNVYDMVARAFEKERAKKEKLKKESVGILVQPKVEKLPAPVKKSKKSKMKKPSDLVEPREVKLLKKIERLCPSKCERLDSRLEKLEIKTRLLLEEKKKLQERKRHLKLRLEKKSLSATERKSTKDKMSATLSPDLTMSLRPGAEFSIVINVLNKGPAEWKSVMLECFSLKGFFLKESLFSLPKLKEGESTYVTLKGRMTTKPGLYTFKARLLNKDGEFGPMFTCWAGVSRDNPDPPVISELPLEDRKESQSEIAGSKGSKKKFDKLIIKESRKKIEENIDEIKKRMEAIDLFRTVSKPDVKSSEDFNVQVQPRNFDVNTQTGAPPNEHERNSKPRDCDANVQPKAFPKGPPPTNHPQDPDFDPRLIQRVLEAETELSETEESYVPMTPNRTGDKPNFGRKAGVDFQWESDSDLSIIYGSEEDEEYIVVPCPFNPPTADFFEEGENPNSENNPQTKSQKSESADKEFAAKTEKRWGNIELGKCITKDCPCVDLIKSKIPPAEDSFRYKKIKPSRSSPYQFAGSELLEPTFASPEEVYYRLNSFNFDQDCENEDPNNAEDSGAAGAADGETQNTKDTENSIGAGINRTDPLGRVIYAVNNKGHCLPVELLLEDEAASGDESEDRDAHGNQGERGNENPTVNILPNMLMNGASNMASLAFNTAKSVINNLQSAFVTEGKTEMGKPACEQKVEPVAMESMFKLYDMGFTDLQKNRELLICYKNNLERAIEALVLLNEKPQPFHTEV